MCHRDSCPIKQLPVWPIVQWIDQIQWDYNWFKHHLIIPPIMTDKNICSYLTTATSVGTRSWGTQGEDAKMSCCPPLGGWDGYSFHVSAYIGWASTEMITLIYPSLGQRKTKWDGGSVLILLNNCELQYLGFWSKAVLQNKWMQFKKKCSRNKLVKVLRKNNLGWQGLLFINS